ncbi:hypothetical protein QZH41_019160 [Actinostola sp. cb2023]|nr:hypothetical protein QZH41_019160 [Actinostola sp. cb2023]
MLPLMIASATDAIQSLFEGDIQLDPEDLALLNRHETNTYKRNAQRMRQGLWRTREIPYEVDTVLVKEGFVEAIHAAIKELHKHTCVRWIRRTAEQNWVKFVMAKKCSSRVGKKYWSEGFQEIHLSSDCKHKGTILHEMMHASGFWHEQSRPDRNQYVEIMWENIEKGREDNFQKYSHPTIDVLGTKYDYKSIMHYGRLAFSSNSEPTIKAVGNPGMELGQRDGLSEVDIIKLNALYDCKSPGGGWSTWSTFTPCGDHCQKYRQRYCTAADTTACPGADYYGIQTQIVRCSSQECNVLVPVDGHWGIWSTWSSCSATCNKGIHTRTRLCDDPAPKRGGKACLGSAVDKQECVMRSCNLGSDDCQFDADMWCHWTQDNTDTNPMDWVRTSKPTLTFGTGPSGDHTSGSGFYVYAEASGPATAGNTARLLSKTFPSTLARCMTF